MARSGCRGFYIGAEAGSQRMLDIYKKEIQVEQIYKTCALARKYGIAIYMSLIVGHPEETFSDKLAIARLLRTTRPQMSGLAPYRAEFARHGVVNYPEYEEREVVSVQPKNGTWSGQADRFRYLKIGLPKSSSKGAAAAP
jgi:anaerobic magnesium-protoporphyrin IX monomethyl ester cyclase